LTQRRPYHPVLFALYPVLALYSLNTALIPATDVLLPAALVLGGTLIVWLLLGLVLRSAARSAAGVSIGVVAIFSYGHLWDLLVKLGWINQVTYVRSDILPFWAIGCLALVVVASWKWKRTEQLVQAMNVGGAILVALPVFSIGFSWFSAWRGTDVRGVSSGVAKLDTSNRPDIYYVILDGYGRSDALSRVIGFSNDWFIKALEDRGFFVAKDGRSNYCETELSLASSLNLDYLPQVLPKLNASWEDRTILDKLIDKNGVSQYLRKLGYRYEALTTGFPAVHPASADLWMQNTQGISLFAGALLDDTPFPSTIQLGGMSQFTARRIMLRGAVQNMVKMSARTMEPRFIFVHILAPHPPFVFGSNGEDVQPKHMGFTIVDGSHYYENGGTPAQYAKGYAGQATYMSKLILSAVDQILSNSSKPPIIILQGDHGSKLKLDQERVDRTDVNECFPNLNAYLVPNQVREKLYDKISPVNSFRIIFNGLFGDRFPVLPDRSFYSGWSSPFKFTEVTDRIKMRSSSPPAPSSPARP
jgi:hypothetical protein